MKKTIEINKVSDTEIEIVEVTPEKVIPEERTFKIVSLKQLEGEKANFEQQKQQLIEWRKTPEIEMEKINNSIKACDEQITKIDVYIQDAISKGVIKDSDVIPTPEPVVDNPVVDNPIVEPITPVEPTETIVE